MEKKLELEKVEVKEIEVSDRKVKLSSVRSGIKSGRCVGGLDKFPTFNPFTSKP